MKRNNWLVLVFGLLLTQALLGARANAAPEELELVDEVPFRRIVIDRGHPLNPHCKAVGDINGDGEVDALAASSTGEGVFWYASPNWSKHRIGLGDFSTDMQTGDIDGDGDLDVIIPINKKSLYWFENPRPAGDPTQTDWKRHQIDEEYGHDVEVGDLNQDGLLDVVARDGETRIHIQQKGKDGAIEWHQVTVPTGGRGGTGLGDLDGDGDLDIAQNGYWLETPSDPDSEWTRHEIAEGWPKDCGVVVTDLNVDGSPDVLIAPAESSGKIVWYSAKDAKAGPWVEHVIEPNTSFVHTFKVGDINNDGLLDVVAAEMEQSPQRRVSVYYNQGGALKWKKQVVGRSGLHNPRIADFGNDGDIDIFGSNHGNQAAPTPIDLWENLTVNKTKPLSLDKWKRHVIDAKRPWKAIFIGDADIDNDGHSDIVTGGWWYRNPGTPSGEWKRTALGEGLHNMAAIFDFDRDGDFDVLGTGGKGSKANATFVWAENNGTGSFRIRDNIDPAQGDFLQGIQVDAFFGTYNYGAALSWHKAGNGIQMIKIPKKPAAEQWTWEKISDESQDEQLSVGHIKAHRGVDLLLGTKWLSNERDGWKLYTVADVPGDPDRNRMADMNGDGRIDAVVGFEAISIPGKIAWYEQPESLAEEWKEHIIGELVGPMSLDVADVDRDGDEDVVIGEHFKNKPEASRLVVIENVDGKATEWKNHVVHTGDEHHDGAILTDIDDDGDLDVLSLGWTHSNVLLYENLAIDE